MIAPWTDPDPSTPLPLLASLREDILAHVPVDRRRADGRAPLRSAVAVVCMSAGFHLTMYYRAAHTARHRLGWPGRAIAWSLNLWSLHHHASTIAPTARLHGGLSLPHPVGIVVGGGAVLGPRSWVYQHATIGGAPGRDGLPTIGADARIGAGAAVLGPVVVGDRVSIGANAVVARDVPADSAVGPAPMVVRAVEP